MSEPYWEPLAASPVVQQGLVPIYSNVLAADANDPWPAIPIPGQFTHLRILAALRGTINAADDYAFVRFNGDAGANYDYQRHYSQNVTVTGVETFAATSAFVGYMPTAQSLPNVLGLLDILIPFYTSPFEKTFTATSGRKVQNSASQQILQQLLGTWRGVAPIASIRLALLNGGLKAGSRVSVYGIADSPIVPFDHGGRVRVRRAATAQSIPSGVWTPVNWDAEDFDTAGYHDLAANTNRLTIPVAGDYLVLCTMGFTSAGGIRGLQINKNSVAPNTNVLGYDAKGGLAGISNFLLISQLVTLAAGDWLSASAYQDTGAALDVAQPTLGSYFGLVKL